MGNIQSQSSDGDDYEFIKSIHDLSIVSNKRCQNSKDHWQQSVKTPIQRKKRSYEVKYREISIVPIIPDGLADTTKENTHLFTFKGRTFQSKIVDVISGNLIEAVINFKGEFTRVQVVLIGYDDSYLDSVDILRDKILDKIVVLECRSFNSSGNLTGSIYHQNQCINKVMERICGPKSPRLHRSPESISK